MRDESVRRFGSMLRCAVVLCVAVLGVTASALRVGADAPADARKLPMTFTYVSEGGAAECAVAACRSWVAASGAITSGTPAAFDALARERDLHGATVVLDSNGGSVLDAIALGRRFRELGIMTTVGVSIDRQDPRDRRVRATIDPHGGCESMCVFVLLSGTKRYVPAEARIRVHQIWLGDRANDARGASYNAQDLMIVQRDIGRLANYAFDMGAPGELLSLALSVPPWEPLYQLTPDDLRRLKVATVDSLSEVFADRPLPAMVSAPPAATVGQADRKIDGNIAVTLDKPVQDKFAPEATQTAEAAARTGGAAPQK